MFGRGTLFSLGFEITFSFVLKFKLCFWFNKYGEKVSTVLIVY